MKPTCLLIVAFVTLSSQFTNAQEKAIESPNSSETIVSELEKEIAALDDAYAAKLKALQTKAIDALQAMRKSVAPQDLDEAIRIRNIENELREHPTTFPKLQVAVNGKSEKGKTNSESDGRKEKAALVAKISKLEKLLGLQSDLGKKVDGTSYRVTFNNNTIGIWTFATNGVLLRDGKECGTRWVALGNDAIICAGVKNGLIDICMFSADGQKLDIIFVGSTIESKTHHSGVLQTR